VLDEIHTGNFSYEEAKRYTDDSTEPLNAGDLGHDNFEK